MNPTQMNQLRFQAFIAEKPFLDGCLHRNQVMLTAE
jgi:hypothetical protein